MDKHCKCVTWRPRPGKIFMPTSHTPVCVARFESHAKHRKSHPMNTILLCTLAVGAMILISACASEPAPVTTSTTTTSETHVAPVVPSTTTTETVHTY